MRTYSGYGKATLEKNMQSFMREGLTEYEARERAKKYGRKFFVKKFPDKELPVYLLPSGVEE